MIYLTNFSFLSEYTEEKYLHKYYAGDEEGKIRRAGHTYHKNMYPFRVLSGIGLFRLDFEPITILCGSNGSGKSTALNIISQKLHVVRKSVYNSGELMDMYVEHCSFETDMRWIGEEFDLTGRRDAHYDIGDISCMITSDDIFKALLQDRVKREQTLMKSRMLVEKYHNVDDSENKWLDFKFGRHIDCETGENLNQYREALNIRKKTASAYLRDKLGEEEVGLSNGENSFFYISELMQKEGLYILDEPENSLSPDMQLKLAQLLLYMARYNNSQIILSTHSPFLLSIPYAKIYDFDAAPAAVKQYEEIESMRTYYDFFTSMKDRFEKNKDKAPEKCGRPLRESPAVKSRT